MRADSSEYLLPSQDSTLLHCLQATSKFKQFCPPTVSLATKRTLAQVFLKFDAQNKNFLMWANGGIRDYVACAEFALR